MNYTRSTIINTTTLNSFVTFSHSVNVIHHQTHNCKEQYKIAIELCHVPVFKLFLCGNLVTITYTTVGKVVDTKNPIIVYNI